MRFERGTTKERDRHFFVTRGSPVWYGWMKSGDRAAKAEGRSEVMAACIAHLKSV